MKRRNWIKIVKWIWLAAIVIGTVWYVSANRTDIGSYLSKVSFARLTFSVVCMIIGKLLLGDLTRMSLLKSGISLPYPDALTINSITQLGKYLPGGVWHFAGKFSVYKLKGLSVKDATRVMILETFWLFSSAALIGLAALLYTETPLFCSQLGIFCDGFSQKFLIGPLGVVWILGSFIFERVLFKANNVKPNKFILSLSKQIVIWILLGISFFLVFPEGTGHGFQIVGAFSISWLVGYAAIFAPGGIGIREFMLALILGIILTAEEVSIFATMHRVVWILVELLMGGLTLLIFGLPLELKRAENKSEMGKSAEI